MAFFKIHYGYLWLWMGCLCHIRKHCCCPCPSVGCAGQRWAICYPYDMVIKNKLRLKFACHNSVVMVLVCPRATSGCAMLEWNFWVWNSCGDITTTVFMYHIFYYDCLCGRLWIFYNFQSLENISICRVWKIFPFAKSENISMRTYIQTYVQLLLFIFNNFHYNIKNI